MAEILSGAEVAKSLDEETLVKVQELKDKGIRPMLVVVRIGEKPGDLAYERGLLKKAEKVGVDVKQCVYPQDIAQEELAAELENINEDGDNHGILVFRPLPKHIDEKKILEKISAKKDVDGVTDASMLGIYSDLEIGNPPCTAEACMQMLRHYGMKLQGKKAVVLGRSLVVGKPLALMLLKENATVTVCHSKSENLEKICQDAEILIAAVGKAKLVGMEFVKKGQTVIDVGINMQDGKLCGDVDFSEVENVVAKISPVPGGVGTVTASVLMSHVVKMAERSCKC